MKRVLVVLADGFEEVEAITPIDILRRAGLKVIVAGLGRTSIKGAHGIKVTADIDLGDLDALPDAVVFPGGMPGAENLAASNDIKELVAAMDAKKGIIAAICASPALVLAPSGILEGKKATCYPGMEKNFSVGITAVKDPVVQDGNIITSRGVGTAIPFALKIVESLSGKDTADTVGEQVLFG